MPEIYVQFGAGFTGAVNWLNFDASPTLRLERIPFIGRFVKMNKERFPIEIKYGDIVRGLPVRDGSVTCVYASHVLEHLSHDDCKIALRNTFKMLKPGGTFRMIVPDLYARSSRYIRQFELGDSDAGNLFIRETYLGRETRPKRLYHIIRSALGNSNHLWMYDELSMTVELESAGFSAIRRCKFGDSLNPAFALVEAESRFIDEYTGDTEVALEAIKPN